MRILLIEDENLAARRLEKLVRQALDPLCPSVLRCAMPEEAVPILRQAYDLVLLDLNLGGFNTMAWLRDRSLRPERTVVVSAESVFEHEALSLGVRAYLLKPLDEVAFRRVLIESLSAV